jgi:hypothetical protein
MLDCFRLDSCFRVVRLFRLHSIATLSERVGMQTYLAFVALLAFLDCGVSGVLLLWLLLWLLLL